MSTIYRIWLLLFFYFIIHWSNGWFWSQVFVILIILLLSLFFLFLLILHFICWLIRLKKLLHTSTQLTFQLKIYFLFFKRIIFYAQLFILFLSSQDLWKDPLILSYFIFLRSFIFIFVEALRPSLIFQSFWKVISSFPFKVMKIELHFHFLLLKR